MSLFEAAAKDALKTSLIQASQQELKKTKENFQIILRSNQNTQSLRTLTAEHVNSMIKVPGIVISASKARSKAVEICVKCSKCQTLKVNLVTSFLNKSTRSFANGCFA
jgi:DNA replication licensing factor MCM5